MKQVLRTHGRHPKTTKDIEAIQIFGMNMPFITQSEAKMHIS